MTVPTNSHSLRAFWSHLFHPSIPFYFSSLSEFHKGLEDWIWNLKRGPDTSFSCLFGVFFFFSGQGEKREIGPETKPACALPCDVCQIPSMPLLRPLSLLHVSSLLHHLSEFISSFFLSLLFTSAPSHLARFCRGDVIAYRSSFPDLLQRGGRVTSSTRTLL